MASKITTLKRWLASRARVSPTTGVIMHSTAGSGLAGAISTLIAKRLSYHYIIDVDGSVKKCVPTSKVAYHAGVSYGWAGANCNAYTIGVAFVNLNDGAKHPIMAAQHKAAVELLQALKVAIPTLRYLSGHRLVSPGRKSDPHPDSYSLHRLAEATGLELWTR